MKLALLSWLSCPDCRGAVRFGSLDTYPREGEEIESGHLLCAGCARRFEIEDCVLRMFPSRALSSGVRRTRERFGWEWMHYPGSLPEDRSIFLEETQVPEPGWRGRLALDVGCGMGRYALAALGLGAEVVAFDLSDAVCRLIPTAREEPRLHLVQGDILKPPFKPGSFDVVYSQGVLHHTSSTRAAFLQAASLVKKGGFVTVWVYGSPGSYDSFATNPLRAQRSWIRVALPLVWLLVWLRRLASDILRLFTTRLPVLVLHVLCYPLAILGAVPLLKYLTFSVHPRFLVRLIENFDWLAPPYQHKHTKEELKEWFAEAGLGVHKQLAHGIIPKVGLLGVRDHAPLGTSGGR